MNPVAQSFQVAKLVELAGSLRTLVKTTYRFGPFLDQLKVYGEEARWFGLPGSYLLRMIDGFEMLAGRQQPLGPRGAEAFLRHLEAGHLFPSEGGDAAEHLLQFRGEVEGEGEERHPISRRTREIMATRGDLTLHEDQYCIRLKEGGPSIPNYEGFKWVGNGSIGVVFSGHPKGDPSRTVAIKVYPISWVHTCPLFLCFEGNLNPDLLAIREASALLVTAIDSGVTLDGDPYIVMPYLEGDSLRDAWRQGGEEGPTPNFDLRELHHLAGQAIEAVALMHERGLVHGDVKPESYLVMPGFPSYLRLLDFDFTRAWGQFPATTTRDIQGTIGYLPPEAFAGVPPNPRFDVFALAASLYYLFTGRPPFAVSSFSETMGEAGRDRLKAEVSQPPMPPSCWNKELSIFLDQVILKGLAVQPEERFRDALELRGAFS